MSSLRKRNAGWVDLTASDDENNVPQRKQPRLSQRSNSQVLFSQPTDVRDSWTEDGQENDIVDLSQDVDEGFGWTLVGAIDGKIVGIRYYNGYATVGEQVMIRREPSNPYGELSSFLCRRFKIRTSIPSRLLIFARQQY